jgi:hypothetical protein
MKFTIEYLNQKGGSSLRENVKSSDSKEEKRKDNDEFDKKMIKRKEVANEGKKILDQIEKISEDTKNVFIDTLKMLNTIKQKYLNIIESRIKKEAEVISLERQISTKQKIFVPSLEKKINESNKIYFNMITTPDVDDKKKIKKNIESLNKNLEEVKRYNKDMPSMARKPVVEELLKKAEDEYKKKIKKIIADKKNYIFIECNEEKCIKLENINEGNFVKEEILFRSTEGDMIFKVYGKVDEEHRENLYDQINELTDKLINDIQQNIDKKINTKIEQEKLAKLEALKKYLKPKKN